MFILKIFPMILLGQLAVSMAVYGAEPDQFTRRDEYLADSAPLLNLKANEAILESIKLANKNDSSCNEMHLYKKLRKYFGNELTGKLVKDVVKNPDFSKRIIRKENSVYRDWNAWDGMGMGIPLLTSKTMSGVIRIGDQTIGTDKLEHMFGQGFMYFKKNYIRNKGVVSAIKGGILREKIILGGFKLGNGVFSYADLAANFNGMRLWNHMLQLRNDVLGEEHNLGPYIACESSKWVQVKEIDFTNYVDDSMDEAINCSKFPSQHTADKFEDRLRIMGMTCPLERDRLKGVRVKYGRLARWIINRDGTAKVKYTNEF